MYALYSNRSATPRRTNAPRPCCTVIMPVASRPARASLTLTRLTPNASHSIRSEGRSAPGSYSRRCMARVSWSRTCCVGLRRVTVVNVDLCGLAVLFAIWPLRFGRQMSRNGPSERPLAPLGALPAADEAHHCTASLIATLDTTPDQRHRLR